jgi:hypothetical protein
MANKKSTSRIIYEMDQTMRGLDRCEALITSKMGKFKRGVKDETRETKSVDDITPEKCHTSK